MITTTNWESASSVVEKTMKRMRYVCLSGESMQQNVRVTGWSPPLSLSLPIAMFCLFVRSIASHHECIEKRAGRQLVTEALLQHAVH